MAKTGNPSYTKEQRETNLQKLEELKAIIDTLIICHQQTLIRYTAGGQEKTLPQVDIDAIMDTECVVLKAQLDAKRAEVI